MVVGPRAGESIVRTEDLEAAIRDEGDRLAVTLLAGVNYATGQVHDIPRLTAAIHETGALAGWQLAHSAGNVPLALHDWDVDFAMWCTYKYLCGGPGSIAQIFVNRRHGSDPNVPRLAGWFGNSLATRFRMAETFDPALGADGWQLSNPPIMALARSAPRSPSSMRWGCRPCAPRPLKLDARISPVSSMPPAAWRSSRRASPMPMARQLSLRLPNARARTGAAGGRRHRRRLPRARLHPGGSGPCTTRSTTPGDSSRPSRRQRDDPPREPHRRPGSGAYRRHVPRRHRSRDRRRPRAGPGVGRGRRRPGGRCGQARVSRLVATPAAERSRILLRIADTLEARLEDFVRAESIDTGKPVRPARSLDIPRAVANFRFFATAILHYRHRACSHTDDRALNYTLRRPRGVAGLISPVEPAALPVHLEDRPGARDRQHGRRQAVRADADDRLRCSPN